MGRVRKYSVKNLHNQLGIQAMQSLDSLDKPTPLVLYLLSSGAWHFISSSDKEGLAALLCDLRYFIHIWRSDDRRSLLLESWRWLRDEALLSTAYIQDLISNYPLDDGHNEDNLGVWIMVATFYSRYGQVAAGKKIMRHLDSCSRFSPEANCLYYDAAGMIAYYEGDLNLAHDLWNKAADIKPNTTILSNLAVISHSLGRNEEALLLLKKLDATVSNPIDQANVLNIRGAVYEELGDTKKAVELYQAAMTVANEARLARHPILAQIKANLGLVMQADHPSEEGLKLLAESLQMRRELFGETHLETANAENQYGLALLDAGRQDEAEQLLRMSLRTREALLPTNHVDTASSHNNLALLAFRKKNYEEATKGFQKALAIYENVMEIEHPVCKQTRNNLKTAKERLGNAS